MCLSGSLEAFSSKESSAKTTAVCGANRRRSDRSAVTVCTQTGICAGHSSGDVMEKADLNIAC